VGHPNRRHIHPGITYQSQHEHKLMGHRLTTAIDEQLQYTDEFTNPLTVFTGVMDQYAAAVTEGNTIEAKVHEVRLGELKVAYTGLSALIAENHLDRN
jgi:hypothetical protein